MLNLRFVAAMMAVPPCSPTYWPFRRLPRLRRPGVVACAMLLTSFVHAVGAGVGQAATSAAASEPAGGAVAPISASLPLVWIGDVAPAVVEEMRYAGGFNFTGARVPGYEAPRCLLTPQAAAGLAQADHDLAPFGLGFKVYDCYRPMRAVRAMVQWSHSQAPPSAAEAFFLASMSRRDVIAKHYLSPRSAHSRGSTVDLTLVARGSAARSLEGPPSAGTSCLGGAMEANGGVAPSGDAATGSVRMGTTHDCFDVRSHTVDASLPTSVRVHRALLVQVMARAGFRNYEKEWWHFTLNHEPYGASCPGFEGPIEAPAR